MKTSFGLTFSERDDGVKVWSAECQGCGALLFGERVSQVTVVRTAGHPGRFKELKEMAALAWDNAKRTGHPIVIGGPDIKVESVHDHGDLQRALEAHVEVCSGR